MIPPPKHKWRGSQCSDHSTSIKKNWNGSPIRISIRVVTHTLEARNIRTSSKVEKDTSEEVWGNMGKLSPRATLNALKTWLVMFPPMALGTCSNPFCHAPVTLLPLSVQALSGSKYVRSKRWYQRFRSKHVQVGCLAILCKGSMYGFTRVPSGCGYSKWGWRKPRTYNYQHRKRGGDSRH